MDEQQKKQYVVNSIRFDNATRISEVLNRYFKSVYSAKKNGDKVRQSETKSDIIEFAEKLFS